MSLRGGPQGRRGPDINRRVCRTHVSLAFGCNPYSLHSGPLGAAGPTWLSLWGEPRGGGSAHRRASRLAGIVMPASRGTSSKSPRFIRHRRRFGDSLPTVVPADSRPLSRPTAGALPRNRLASSATGGASAISLKFPLPAQKGRADRWPVRPQVRRKMVRKKQYYSSMASSHTAPMAAPPNRAASHGDIRSRRRGGAPWVRA